MALRGQYIDMPWSAWCLVQVDTSDPDFIDRFWIGYWQGRALARRAFPPDAWPEQPVLPPGWAAWTGEDTWPGDTVLESWR